VKAYHVMGPNANQTMFLTMDIANAYGYSGKYCEIYSKLFCI